MRKNTIFILIIFLVCAQTFGDDNEKRKIKLDDLYNLKQISQLQYSPDGCWIAFVVTKAEKKANSYNSDIWKIPAGGGVPVRLTRHKQEDHSPQWSPDGKYLAFLSERTGKSQIWLFYTQGGEPRQLTKMNNGVERFIWTPDGARIAFIAKDPEPKDKKKSDVIVVNRLQHKRDGEGYLDEKRDHIWLISVENGQPQRVTEGPFDEEDIGFSPDGKEIIFVSNRFENPDANENTDLWTIEIERGRIRQLTTNVGPDAHPSWSHDGKSIAYLASLNLNNVSGITYLWRIDAEGGNPVNLTENIDRNVAGWDAYEEVMIKPVWSADDKHIYFILEDGGNWHVCRIHSSGGNLERLVAGERTASNLVLSPDGQDMAFTLDEPLSPPEIYTAEADGQGLRKLTSLNEGFVAGLELSRPVNIHYQSFDGQEIEGWVMKPMGFQPGKRYPMVLWVHGGPQYQLGTFFDYRFQLLAAAGYVVLYTNPRGSTGYGESFTHAIWADWGNKDLKDVLAGVDHVVEMGFVDPGRIGITGWSYGGEMTNFAITRTDRFKAAVAGASDADYFSCYGYDDLHVWWETEVGLPWEKPELYRKLSSIYDVNKVKTPTLYLHGQNDYRCPLPQAELMYLRLKKLGVDTELVIYPDESHSLSQPDHQIDRYRRTIEWFDKYLKPKSNSEQKK